MIYIATGFQVVFHIAHGKDDELFVHVDIRRAIHEPAPGAFGVF
jgi:hypothetical protein